MSFQQPHHLLQSSLVQNGDSHSPPDRSGYYGNVAPEESMTSLVEGTPGVYDAETQNWSQSNVGAPTGWLPMKSVTPVETETDSTPVKISTDLPHTDEQTNLLQEPPSDVTNPAEDSASGACDEMVVSPAADEGEAATSEAEKADSAESELEEFVKNETSNAAPPESPRKLISDNKLAKQLEGENITDVSADETVQLDKSSEEAKEEMCQSASESGDADEDEAEEMKEKKEEVEEEGKEVGGEVEKEEAEMEEPPPSTDEEESTPTVSSKRNAKSTRKPASTTSSSKKSPSKKTPAARRSGRERKQTDILDSSILSVPSVKRSPRAPKAVTEPRSETEGTDDDYVPRTPSSTKSKKGKTPASAPRSKSKGGRTAKVAPIQDRPVEPLRRVEVAREDFGGMKFTKAFSDDERKAKSSLVSRLGGSFGAGREIRESPVRSPGGNSSCSSVGSGLKSYAGSRLQSGSQKSHAGDSSKRGKIAHQSYMDKPENVVSKFQSDSSKKSKKSTGKVVVGGASSKTQVKKGSGPSLSLFSGLEGMEDVGEESGGVAEGEDDAYEAPKTKTRGKTTTRTTPATLPRQKPKRRRSPSPGEFASKSAKKEPSYDLPTSPQEQLNADCPTDSQGSLSTGARVMAKWGDCFYPGVVLFRDGLGRYKIRFMDDAYRSMPAPDVIPIVTFKPGDILMFKVPLGGDEEEFQPVRIIECPSTTDSNDWYEGLFTVENQTTEMQQKAFWSDLVIDKEQTKPFVANMTNKALNEITLDNIASPTDRTSRTRRARASIQPGALAVLDSEDEKVRSSKVVKSSSKKVPARKRKPAETETPPGPSKKATKPKKTKPKVAAKVKPVAVVGPVVSEQQSHLGGDGSSMEDTACFEEEDGMESEEDVSSGFPQIFRGFSFILTSANRRGNGEAGAPPFNKKIVRQLIEERGGDVFDDFEHVTDRFTCFLVADTHYRTHKYLSALARAIPCVSHAWIHNCCSEGKRVDFKCNMLKAGHSLETGELVEWHEENPTLLKDLNFYVYTAHQPSNPQALNFVQIWAPLVKAMGANLVEELPEQGSGATIDFLLTDMSCPEHILERARADSASIVSSEWLIQAIITGERPNPSSHSKYKYDYVEGAS